jgi:hypothetical protein
MTESLEASALYAGALMCINRAGLVLIALILLHAEKLAAEPGERGTAWNHHSIDDSARGADGVRLADANGDGLLDIATGWEEAGLIRLYLNPGAAKAKQPWPKVTVGQVHSPEDAVLVDLDGDGGLDIVSCCEGKTRSVFVHWSPGKRAVQGSAELLNGSAWATAPFPALSNRQAAMYCLPVDMDGEGGIDLVVGSKGPGANIGWLQSPREPRDLAAWKYHRLAEAGWIMSLVATDLDRDGDADILGTDRKGSGAGCLWLENPGRGERQMAPWKRHSIGPMGIEVMFLHHADLDGDGRLDVLVPTYDKRIFLHRRLDGASPAWETQELPYPQAAGKGKSMRVADLDLDGRLDLVLSTENYEGTSGVVWMSRIGPGYNEWKTHEVSGFAGPQGLKLDDVQLLDLDADGDVDLLTTEERTGWGVVWFENPTR